MPVLFCKSFVGVAKATLVFRTFPFQSKSCLTALALVLWAGMTPTQAQPLQYPDTRKVDQVDTYFNQVVEDPYRWLEDDVRQSKEVAAWRANPAHPIQLWPPGWAMPLQPRMK